MSATRTTAYEWVKTRGYKIDAQLVGETVERLAEDSGGLAPPRALWLAASPVEHPLHGMFEWNTKRAAESYRDIQARRIISSLRISGPEEGDTAPAFLHYRVILDDGVAEGYMHSPTIRANGPEREFAIQEAIDSLTELEERYKSLNELSSVWTAIRQIRRQYV